MSIEKAEAAEDVKNRVINLIDSITFSVFNYTSRGLFEKDKLIFVTQMCFTVSIYILLSYYIINYFIMFIEMTLYVMNSLSWLYKGQYCKFF